MRFNNPSRGTSFYESFSDLIFGTLIIFLVVVLALMLRIRSKEAEFKKAAESEIALNQYAGGTSETTWAFSFVIIDGQPRVAFVPREVWQDWNLSRDDDDNVISYLCAYVTENDPPIPIMTIDEFTAIGGAFSMEMVHGAVINPEIGDVLTRVFTLARPGSNVDVDPEAIYQRIGGRYAGTHGEQDTFDDPAVRTAVDRFFAFLAGPGAPMPEGHIDQFFRQYAQLRMAMQAEIEPTAGLPARLLFSAEARDQVRIGGTTVTNEQFHGIIASISVGRGFYVEYDGPGDEPESPPDWIIDELLVPSGFNLRIPSNEALDALRD